MEESREGSGGGTGGNEAFEEANRLAKRNELDAAEAAYRKADEAGHPTAAAYVGIFDEGHGNRDDALAAYQRADERGDGYGALRLGMLLSRAGDWDGAAAAWERADERGTQPPPFDSAALLGGRDATAAEIPPEVQRSAFANPVLLGSITVLVAIIGVFLAYNANTGLPFVPTRELKVVFPNGAALVTGNDVYSGGYRIGLVSDMHPVALRGGQIGAQATLALNKSYGGVPVDSHASIRPRSLLGLKYIDITRGSSHRVFPDGATLPISETVVGVQFDDINKMFNDRSRPAIQQDLTGFGNTFASRGSSLNDTIATLPALFKHVIPVARYLTDPHTELTRFFVALNGFFGTVAPVARQNEQLFADQARTFAAIAHNASDLENTIRESPPTLDVSTASLKAQQPFLVDLTTFSRYFGPAAAQLRQALPQIDPALEAGIRVLPRTPSMNRKLQGVLGALRAVGQDPLANVAVNGLTDTVNTLNPLIRYVGPFVTVCNDFNYTWTEFGDLVSEPTRLGTAQRALIQSANHQSNNVNQAEATGPANGYDMSNPQDRAWFQQTGGIDAEYFHSQTYAAAIDNQGRADCEFGQRGFPLNLNHLDPHHRDFATDAYTPGDQGMNWTGLSRVPPGETYSRRAQTGPQLPYIPSNP